MKDPKFTLDDWRYCKTILAIFIFSLCLLGIGNTYAQVNTGGSATTANHNKQVIGYITNWDAWKSVNAGVPAQGALNHLNIDYNKYTILNYSFFGVAVDGSLHSGDHRNKNIYQSGAVQQPDELIHGNVYDSWDLHLLLGEIETFSYISPAIKERAEAFGYIINGNEWLHPKWRISNNSGSGNAPLPLPKEGGAPGVIELSHQNGVKIMASIGGWSMCKHFPEMAADPVKRARFIEDCKTLIEMGFDGIDLDWEYPGPFPGMNFTGTNADYANFENLVQEIRNAIGPDKLITAAMAADYKKIEGFNWSKLSSTMDYFNMMTYDFNGGWSNIAGHNAPVYPYDGAEAPDFNWQTLLDKMKGMGVPVNKINFGAPFYGRGVVTDGTADLNAPTVKRNVTIQPDGPVSTAADYTNWPLEVYDGTPNHFFIKQKTGSGSGWTRKWDDQAKVPYMVKGNFFLSYDDEESITEKAKFINTNNLAGTIIWTVFGDLEFSGSPQSFGTKLKRWSNVQSPLINKMNEIFASGGTGNPPPTVAITSPSEGATFTAGDNINITADAADNVSIARVEFYNGSSLLGQDTTAPYSYSWNNVSAGSYSIIAKAYDNENVSATSSVSITVTGIGGNVPPVVNITSPSTNATFTAGATINIEANASDSDGTISKVEFYNGSTLLGEDNSAPYSYSWNNVSEGNYTIIVKAIDNENAEGSSSVSITVNGTGGEGCTAPAWVSGQAYTGGQVVSYQGREYKAKWWTQQTPGGSEWEDLGPCDGGNPPGGSCTAPAWVSGQAYNGGDIVSLDNREYKAKWWTQQNPVGSSEWEDLGPCDGGGDGAPQISITSPTSGQSFIEGNSIVINATASDSDGSISKVEFYNNGTYLGQDTTSPYSYTINNASIGSYTFTAKATDNSNQSTTSTGVNINVTSDGGCTGNGFKVVGYMPSWQGSANAIQYDKLTHINYSFLLPNSNGTLRPLDNVSKMQQIVSLGHAQGVKVLIAVGGWMDGNDSPFSQLAANPTTRTAFVNNLVDFVNQYDLDGVDMDWEYPREGNEPQHFELLMQELGQAMHSRGKLLTAAVVVAGWNADGVLNGVFDDVDFLNIMAYDGPDHSTMAQAESGLNYWLGRGLPKEKAILGVPFYSRPQAQSYASLLSQGASPNSDSFQGNNYNGIPTIKAKTQMALDRAGGIMMWELSHDTTDPSTSLLAAINQVVGDPCTPDNVAPQVSITSPQSGNTYVAGNNINIAANASDSDGNITKVAFYIDGNMISEDISSPYTANWTAINGNHTITARATDNDGATTTSSGVSITVSTGDTNTPPSISITSPSSGATYDVGQSISITANASDPGGSVSKVTFYVDGTMISEDSSSPFTANWTATLGNHDITAMATDNEGATASSAVVNITIQSDTGGDCSTAQYVDGSAYETGDKVQNSGKEYECLVGGWCSVGGPYEPGVGWAWPNAWKELGECGGGNPPGGNQSPTVSITQPLTGESFAVGSTITINASASDADGNVTKVEFFRNGVRIGEDTTSPYSYTWNNASTGNYTLTAKATDNENAMGESSVVSISVGSVNPPNPGGDLPKRILVGYWHNFDNSSSLPKLREVSDKWDVINVSFAIPTVLGGSTMTFSPDPAIYSSAQEFKDDVALLQSRGKKVLISMGGATGAVDVSSPTDAQAFSSSMISIIREYGFDGMDIDFEGSSVSLAAGDTDFKNPTSPKIVNLINGCRTILSQFSSDFILSMAPETLFVQGGFSGYGGASGAYLPIIYALRNEMDYIHVQHYNTGCMLGLDGLCYSQGNADFQVAMAEMLLQGFPVAGGQQFPALRQDQMAIGLPASPSAAGGGYTAPAEVHKALDYLIKGQSFGGRYTLRNPSGYANFRGLMTWSINWDIVSGFGFSNPHRAYLDALDSRSPGLQLSKQTAVVAKNPFDTEVEIDVKLESTQSITAEVYNQIGVKVGVINDYQKMKAGNHKLKWTADDVPSGLYFLKLRIGKEVRTIKLMKQ
ncbi:glycosyl hydrolase family 18 protein [Aquimarina sp. MMG016]|uniref:glycosyl hydrolase family 18 protein n=1 Tax=Aquimarina sp. MMG016 TaxID=2822690 RepID=UPI001B3A1547|nr:glycosyl hydrolase family 18 protein [Aquimarina sp. MMG016]MBQ4822717.1 T9SS type A sorting domain-containing protein [Aquimarina sp. MMG016]